MSKNIDWMAEGTKVSGTYCGFAFTGTVVEVRWAPRGSYFGDIAFDAPIKVYGQIRTSGGFYSGDEEAQQVAIIQ